MAACINCQSCVRACDTIAGQSVLVPQKVDGKDIIVTKLGKPLAETNCIGCGQCTLVCPTSALKEKDAISAIDAVLRDKRGRTVVIQTAPAIRINMGEALGLPAGTISTGKMVTALKLLGFDYVFDTNFGADLTIVEEATELLERLQGHGGPMPMFTSCCPAWVNYVERNAPDLIPNLSSCRSPVGMLSAAIKTDFATTKGIDAKNIVNCSAMPCTAKKDEAKRAQLRTKGGDQETDIVLTSREIARMIKRAKIDFKALPDAAFDSVYSEASGGGAIFCATGGVMEAAVRAAHKFATGKELAPIEFGGVRGAKDGVKEAAADIGGRRVRVAVAHGIANAMRLIQRMKAGEAAVDFVEVMACPGGCVCGGGAPRARTKKAVDARLDATYKIDRGSAVRTSSENLQVKELYERALGGKFGSAEAHAAFHTKFAKQ